MPLDAHLYALLATLASDDDACPSEERAAAIWGCAIDEARDHLADLDVEGLVELWEYHPGRFRATLSPLGAVSVGARLVERADGGWRFEFGPERDPTSCRRGVHRTLKFDPADDRPRGPVLVGEGLPCWDNPAWTGEESGHQPCRACGGVIGSPTRYCIRCDRKLNESQTGPEPRPRASARAEKCSESTISVNAAGIICILPL